MNPGKVNERLKVKHFAWKKLSFFRNPQNFELQSRQKRPLEKQDFNVKKAAK